MGVVIRGGQARAWGRWSLEMGLRRSAAERVQGLVEKWESARCLQRSSVVPFLSVCSDRVSGAAVGVSAGVCVG